MEGNSLPVPRRRTVSPYVVTLVVLALLAAGAVVYSRRHEPLYGDVFSIRPPRAMAGPEHVPAFAPGAPVEIGLSLVNRGRLPVRVTDVLAVEHTDVDTVQVRLEQSTLRRRGFWRRGPVPFHPVTIAPGQTRRVLLSLRLRECAAQARGSLLEVPEVPVRISVLGASRVQQVPLEYRLAFRYERSQPANGRCQAPA